jgi:transcriptional regulator with GAF, ATPase, and Fis domain
VNCAALSEELLETELFGHERGAFTSAVRSHRGRFERAHMGTLFLDEIGELPLRLQAKLLRVLEAGVIERVGGEREVTVDVRLISATNVPLEQAVQARTFRLDLYLRLEVLRIHMPPLRERAKDIPLLAAHFLEQLNAKYQRQIQGLTPEAMALLQTYHWPGNIRELRNVLERVVVETTADVIGRRAFDEWVQERSRFYPGHWDVDARETARSARPTIITPYPAASQASPLLSSPIHDMESTTNGVWRLSGQSDIASFSRQEPIDVTPHELAQPVTPECLAWAYQQAGGNITRAARLLGVHKATFYRHMKALGLTREALEQPGAIPLDQLATEERPAGEAHE